jgi:hypothetical protein
MRAAPSKARVAAFVGLFTAAGCLAIDTSGLMAERIEGDAAPSGPADGGTSERPDAEVACAVGDAAAAMTDGCAPQSKQLLPEYVRCETFDGPGTLDAAGPGSAATDTSTFVSSPASALVALPASDAAAAERLGLALSGSFNKLSMEADVLVSPLSTPISLMSIDVSPSSSPAQRFDLIVDARGKLTVRATLPAGGFEDKDFTVGSAGLCPGRWTHVRLRLDFNPTDVTVALKAGPPGDDDEAGTATRPFATTTAPQTGATAKGAIGIARETGAPSLGVRFDNWQFYVW